MSKKIFIEILKSGLGFLIGPILFALVLIIIGDVKSEFIGYWTISKLISSILIFGLDKYIFQLRKTNPDLSFFRFLIINLKPFIIIASFFCLLLFFVQSNYNPLILMILSIVFGLIDIYTNLLKSKGDLVINQFFQFGLFPLFYFFFYKILHQNEYALIFSSFTIIFLIIIFNQKGEDLNPGSKISFKFSIYSASNSFINRVKSGNDVFLLNLFHVNASSSFDYFFSKQALSIIGFPLMLMNNILIKQLSKNHSKKKSYDFNRIISFIGAILVVAMVIYLNSFFKLIPLKIIVLVSLGFIISSFFGGVNTLLIYSNNEKLLFRVNLFLISLCPLIYFICLSKYGFIGLLYANLIVEFLMNTMAFYYVKYYKGGII